MANVLEITDANFDAEVLNAQVPFLLDFTAVWCGPCKMLSPVIEKIADENFGKIKVGKIDLDASPVTAVKLGIRGVPTVVIFKNGKESKRHIGVTNKETLLALVNA